MAKEFFGLEGKTVVVTGASGGVGESSARMFASLAGANIALISRQDTGDLATELSSHQILAKSYQADVKDSHSLRSTFESIGAEFGKIHSLLNIAGACEFYPQETDPLEKTVIDEDRWDHIIGVNGKGVALAIQYAVEHMEAGASIVNVGSTAGRYGADLAVIDYSFAKAGVIGLTMGYAKILGPLGIRVNGVAPGPIEGTEMLSRADENTLAGVRSRTMLGRLCQVEDIAKINLFLASNMSSVMTGDTIDANCGQFISF